MKTDLPQRTRRFALDVIRYCAGLPREQAFQVIGRQLVRSATSVGANYRAACRARSRADFVNKLGIVEEEADETSYWLELLAELQPGRSKELGRLCDEAGQLTAIVVASRKTARKRK
ncbi:four helix bundle protein [candidate division WOR-3 bacterium]|nr:four helix bundle protein [candidate division WOR-3 bacterium]